MLRLSSIFFLICVGLVTLFSSVVVAQDTRDDKGSTSAPIIVSKFRSELSELQKQYLDDVASTDGLGRRSETAVFAEYVDILRGDLRRVVMANLGASNEADRAVTRAAIALLEKQLAAYESVYGKWGGIRSDRWSVLTSAELDGIEEQLRQRMRLLLTDTISLPISAGSPGVLALKEELRTQIEMLQAERARRGTFGAQLMGISETATAPLDGAAFRQLDKVAGRQLEFEAEKLLAFEIEKGKAWDPGNRALEFIDVEIKTRRSVVAACDRLQGHQHCFVSCSNPY